MIKKLFIFFIIFFLFHTKSYALMLLDDNFDSLNNVNWNFNAQDGSIISDNGVLKLRSTGYNFPIVLSRFDNLFSSQNNVVFEVKFMFESVSSMGNGISVGFTGQTGWPFYQFSVWNDTADGLRFVSNNFNTYNFRFCISSNPDDWYAGFVSKKLNLNNSVWHKFRIEKNGTQFDIYMDKDSNPVPLLSTQQNQCVPTNIFLGNQLGGGSTTWTSLNIDYIKVGDGLWSDITQNKIVFLTGMGGSWNEKAMVLNQVVPQSEWRMTPFVKNYDSMFAGFETNGLVKNTDYFVYNYDWRKPIANQVSDFDSYVSGLGLASGEKIDIVGHSLGGLIGRLWTQQNSNKVGKVVTLASPHFGAVKVYDMWNGAKIANPTDPGSIALNVLLALQRKNNQTAVETIRAYAPALKDILPTFDYLKKKGKIVNPQQNSYLMGQNTNTNTIFPQLLAVDGKGTKTDEWINLTERNLFDIVLGRWEQGRPLSYLQTDGDGTVLHKSATFNGDGNATVVANHGDVPDKSVNLVLSELGLGKTIATVASSNFKGAVFYMGSPATMKVNCGAGDINETDGFVLVPNSNIADCVVKLTGTDDGIYHLVMGNSDDDESWKYSEGNITIGENKSIAIKTVDFWYEQMLRETNSLLVIYPTNKNLKSMKIAILAKNRVNLFNSYLLFRKQKLETIITWRMVNYLEKIINIEIPAPSLVQINRQKLLAMSAKSLANKTASLKQRRRIYPNTWQSLNYTQGEELFLSPNYGKYLLAEKIFAMVWY